MDLSPSVLKLEAKKIIASSKPHPVTAAMLYLLLWLAVSFLSVSFIGSVTQAEAEKYMNYLQSMNLDGMMDIISAHAPSTKELIVICALWLTVIFVSVGMTVFLLNTARGRKPVLGNLLDGFSMPLRLMALALILGVMMYIGLILIIPAIVMFYAYRFSFHIMIDHPELSVFACMRESRRMMKHNKMKLFALDLSFIILIVLQLMPFISYAVRVWSVPYMRLTTTLFYERIRTAPEYSGRAASIPEFIGDAEEKKDEK